jgi:hypothetical protein
MKNLSSSARRLQPACRLQPMRRCLQPACRLQPMGRCLQPACRLQPMGRCLQPACRLQPMRRRLQPACRLQPVGRRLRPASHRRPARCRCSARRRRRTGLRTITAYAPRRGSSSSPDSLGPALRIGVTYGGPPWGPGPSHALTPLCVTGGPLDPPGALRHILRAGARLLSDIPPCPNSVCVATEQYASSSLRLSPT